MLFPYINSYGERISKQSTPFVGAQIFIEPGQTQEQIEQWFKLLAEKQYDHLSDPYVRKYMKPQVVHTILHCLIGLLS